jgi:hypothetical protein
LSLRSNSARSLAFMTMELPFASTSLGHSRILAELP